MEIKLKKIVDNLRTATDLRKQDGSVYKRASYMAARGALQRHLTSLDRTFSINKDKEFVKANSVLDGVLKQNKKSGLEEGVEHKRALSAEDWDLVQEYFKKVSTSSDPVSICRYVWFVVSLHFCLRGREIQSQVNKCDLVFGKDENDCDIVTLSKDFMSKNHQVGLKGSAFSSAGCITDSEQVATVRRYLDHLHPSYHRLFQRARIASQPEDATWFMNMPLSHKLLGKMMSQISADAKLSAVYTDHCVRATSITRMKSAHFEDRKICSVSGHKNATSLQAYDRLSSNDIISMLLLLLLLLLNFILIHQMHRHCCLLDVGGSPHLSLNDEY